MAYKFHDALKKLPFKKVNLREINIFAFNNTEIWYRFLGGKKKVVKNYRRYLLHDYS